jgi:hypothetical protein
LRIDTGQLPDFQAAVVLDPQLDAVGVLALVLERRVVEGRHHRLPFDRGG